LIAEIATKYRVISLDLPGHGASDKPDAESAYGAQMADDFALLLDHLKVEKAHFIGYSLGGMVALKFASRHPDRVKSLILGGMGWLKEGSLLQRFWGNVSGRENSKTPEACIRGIAALAVSETDLKAIQIPVTVIIGSQDPVKRMYVRPLLSARPDWPVTEIPDAGHLSTLMKPQFRREIMGWLDKQPRP
jgi:pimeloyl-ACP methyl ester carboxylesterase